ncbi:MAG: hypothetical protein QM638_15085 [Nocardioides sp.]|uniref:hypothetical protein n=1 Tax=Nocardioides sp. TaxID=35761 RepID=UPI0039E2423E
MSLSFVCSRSLTNALGGRLLGAYDGSGAWQIYLSELGNSEEQLYVEMHEGMHHELQASTGWGLVSAMASELARRGFRREPLEAVFHRMVEHSRSAHEMFATAISSFVVGKDRARELLVDNILYSDYLRQAEGLVPRSQAPSDRFHQAAVAAVLRAVMSPQSTLRLLAVGYDRLQLEDLADDVNTPEVRIEAYLRAATADGWLDLFETLTTGHPEQVQGPWDDKGTTSWPDEDSQEFQARRTFEEEILLPACYRHVEQILDNAGYPTVRFGAQSELANGVKAAVDAVDPVLAARLRLVTERRPVADDGLEYDRQQIVLRKALPAVVHPYTNGASDREFLTWEGANGSTMLGIWLSAPALRKQWALEPEDADSLPGTVRALLQVGTNRESGTPIAVIATLPQTGPREAQTLIGESVPLVVVTSHSSLVDTDLANELKSVEPVFVLMDLPVAHQIAAWIAQGLDVRMAASPLDGTATGLWLLAFAITEMPAFVFLSLGGSTGVSMLIERLRRAHDDALRIDADVLVLHAAGINLAVAKILASWHVLDQDGIESTSAGG